jgi:hypothetical protein
MIVAMGTAFTMGGQASSRPSPYPIADDVGVDHDPKQDPPVVDAPVPSTQSASATGTWSHPQPARAASVARSAAPVVSTVQPATEVKPDPRASTFAGAERQFAGAEYLTDCLEIQRMPGIGSTAESRSRSSSPDWPSSRQFAAFCGAQPPLRPSG